MYALGKTTYLHVPKSDQPISKDVHPQRIIAGYVYINSQIKFTAIDKERISKIPVGVFTMYCTTME